MGDRRLSLWAKAMAQGYGVRLLVRLTVLPLTIVLAILGLLIGRSIGLQWPFNLAAALLMGCAFWSLIFFDRKSAGREGSASNRGSGANTYAEYRARRDRQFEWEKRRRFDRSTGASIGRADPNRIPSPSNQWAPRRSLDPDYTDPKVAEIRREYRKSLSADPAGYQERLAAAQSEIENEEAEEGIEELGALLGAARESLDPTSPESRHAVDYAGSSVLEVFRMIGPPPPGIYGPPGSGDGGVPDSGADIPSGGRRG